MLDCVPSSSIEMSKPISAIYTLNSLWILFWHGRSDAHDYSIHIQVRREEFLIVWMLTKIQINHILEMSVGKIHHTTGFATLADTSHDKRLVRGIIQP